jgi:hypothetical protein
MLNKINFDYSRLPIEIVNEIADYHDFQKYCKPDHKIKFDNVMNDIISMNEIMKPISAKLAKECWGSNPNIFIEGNVWETTFPVSTDLYEELYNVVMNNPEFFLD